MANLTWSKYVNKTLSQTTLHNLNWRTVQVEPLQYLFYFLDPSYDMIWYMDMIMFFDLDIACCVKMQQYNISSRKSSNCGRIQDRPQHNILELVCTSSLLKRPKIQSIAYPHLYQRSSYAVTEESARLTNKPSTKSRHQRAKLKACCDFKWLMDRRPARGHTDM